MPNSRTSSLTDQLEPFDLRTLSGVRPGTRTSIFQRLRIRAIDAPNHSAQWFLLAWNQTEDEARLEQLCGNSVQPDGQRGILQIPHPGGEEFAHKLQERLAESGLALEACGTCTYWHRSSDLTPEGLPLGRCSHRNANEAEGAPDVLAYQSVLAMSCAAWQSRSEIDRDKHTANDEEKVADVPATSRKEQPVRPALLQRLADLFSRQCTTADDTPGLYAERSGVGAGTEPCFACQARIANFGALTVDTPEGDQETFSVWRCRHCGTNYISDWIDRWARLDSLETEETFYRIPPSEAAGLLSLFSEYSASRTPEKLAQRSTIRERILSRVQLAVRLSHQKKLGR